MELNITNTAQTQLAEPSIQNEQPSTVSESNSYHIPLNNEQDDSPTTTLSERTSTELQTNEARASKKTRFDLELKPCFDALLEKVASGATLQREDFMLIIPKDDKLQTYIRSESLSPDEFFKKYGLAQALENPQENATALISSCLLNLETYADKYDIHNLMDYYISKLIERPAIAKNEISRFCMLILWATFEYEKDQKTNAENLLDAVYAQTEKLRSSNPNLRFCLYRNDALERASEVATNFSHPNKQKFEDFYKAVTSLARS